MNCIASNCRDLLRPPTQLTANNRRRKDIFILPKADQDLLTNLGYKEKLAEADKAILANAAFLNLIVDNPEIFGHNVDDDSEGEEEILDNSAPQPGSSRSHADHGKLLLSSCSC